MKERKAIFTVEVPVRFTMETRADMDCDKLLKTAEKMAAARLRKSKVEFNPKEVEVIDKKVIYTCAEIEEMNRAWENFLKGVKERTNGKISL